MPFDPSGNFTRTQNFTQDRNNGLKILASHVDNEFDNFASGMNQVFFRNGLVPMTGDLNVGTNRVLGLSNGTVSAPAITFAGDGMTGIYSLGTGNFAIAAGGAQSAGFSATGQTLYGQTNFGGDANYNARIAGGTPYLFFDNNDVLGYDRTNNAFNFVIGSTNKMSLGPTALNLAVGLAVNAGTVELYNSGGVSLRNCATAEKNIRFDQGIGGRTSYFYGNAGAFGAYDTANGDIWAYSYTDNSFRIKGQVAWTAGNFNPGLYAPLSGAAFSGNVTGTAASFSGIMNATSYSVAGDTAFYFSKNGANPFINYDFNDYYYYDRASNAHAFAVGNQLTAVFRGPGGNVDLFGTGMYFNSQTVWHAANFNPGSYAALNNAVTFQDIAATRGDGTGVIYFGGSGSYIYYNGSKWIFRSGGQDQFSVDNSGTLRVRGDIIAFTTP